MVEIDSSPRWGILKMSGQEHDLSDDRVGVDMEIYKRLPMRDKHMLDEWLERNDIKNAVEVEALDDQGHVMVTQIIGWDREADQLKYFRFHTWCDSPMFINWVYPLKTHYPDGVLATPIE